MLTVREPATGQTIGPLLGPLLRLMLGLICSACGSGDPGRQPPRPIIDFEEVGGDAGFGYSGQSWGLAVGDFDNDGWPDLYSSNHGGAAMLWRNFGGGFVDASARMDQSPRGDSHGAAWADFDNDGDQDLVQVLGARRGQGEGPNRFFVNRMGRLSNEASASGIADPLGRGRSALWLDWNNDGLLDILLSNAPRPGSPSRVLIGGQHHFESLDAKVERPADSLYARAQSAGLILVGGELAIVVVAADGTRLLRPALGSPPMVDLGVAPSGWATADLDGDGELDLVLAKGASGPEVFQPGRRHLQAHLPLAGTEREIEFESAGAVAFDLRPSSSRWWRPGDVRIGAAGWHPETTTFSLDPTEAVGWPTAETAGTKAIRIGFDPDTATWRLAVHAPGHDVLNLDARSEAPIVAIRPHGFAPGRREGWLRWLAGPEFRQRAEDTLAELRSCGSVAAGDFDNDTDIDLYLVCSEPGRNSRDILLENSGSGAFTPVANAGAALASELGTGDRVVVLDFDRDGRLDLVVSNGAGMRPFDDGPLQLLHNRSAGAHWLAVELHGGRSNRDGIGARVQLETESGCQLRLRGTEMRAGSQDQSTIHFGLGQIDSAALTVEWPSGAMQRFRDLPADRVAHIREPG